MKIGDIMYIQGEKYVVAKDKSTKDTPMFEAWNVKTGKIAALAGEKNDKKNN